VGFAAVAEGIQGLNNLDWDADLVQHLQDSVLSGEITSYCNTENVSLVHTTNGALKRNDEMTV
jgi:hypothetical protein